MRSETLKSGDYATFKKLATFENVDKMNLFIRKVLYNLKHKLTPSAIKVLKKMSQYACKYPGVCWVKIKTLAAEIGVSERTIKRAIKLLEELGIIEKYLTMRSGGGYGHPVFVINNHDHDEFKELPNSNVTSDVTSEMSPRQEAKNTDISKDKQHFSETETIISKTVSSRENKMYKRKERAVQDIKSVKLTKDFTSDRVPVEFRDLVGCFFDDAEQIEEYWKVVWLHSRHLNEDKETILDVAIKSFKQLVRKLKKGLVRNPFGYFFGIVNKKLDELHYQSLRELYEQEVKDDYEFNLTPDWDNMPEWLKV
jgi:predicted transcriptional regulator